jgi:hypothetical protein
MRNGAPVGVSVIRDIFDKVFRQAAGQRFVLKVTETSHQNAFSVQIGPGKETDTIKMTAFRLVPPVMSDFFWAVVFGRREKEKEYAPNNSE